MTMSIEPVTDEDWLQGFVIEHWGAPGAVSRGLLISGPGIAGFKAIDDGSLAAVVTWRSHGEAWEIVTIDALTPHRGFGTALLHAVAEAAREAGARRLTLITTNDNLDALRFYQRRGWRIVAIHQGAVALSRRIKPAIPETGSYNIPIRDEIELEYPL